MTVQVMALPASADISPGAEACFVESINAERVARGIDPMTVDADLLSYARNHTQKMIDSGGLFHSTSAQLSAVLPDGANGWGENVGYASDCDRLHQAFMDSPGHKANLLNPKYTRMVIGAVVNNGALWATEIFYSHPGLPPFWDDDGSPHEGAIIKLAERGVTGGCGEGRYCPDATVTRGQMAVFLTRALGLPASPVDYFSDDAGHPFEAEINAIAHAGVTSGCGSGSFCPYAALSRAEMATFLVRAVGLAPTSTDYFSDDTGSLHEADINALAAAGVTTGCAEGRFCPHGALTRAQMATFLVLALGW